MGFNSSSFDYESKEHRERMLEPHPIWRGIGFALIFLTPIVAFAISDILVQWLKVKDYLFVPAGLQYDFQITPTWIIYDLWIVLMGTVILSLLLGSIFSMINAIVYDLVSDKTHRIFESEAEYYKKKKRRRRK